MRTRSLPFAVYVVLALAAIFWLPLHVPMQPTGSISYMLGFNNHAALLALLASLAVGGLLVRGLGLEPQAVAGTATGPDRRNVMRAVVATVLLCAALTWLVSSTWGIDESPYLIGRVRQLLGGARPYVEFEFIYGPALLYLPAWTARLLGVAAGPAYFLVWCVEWLLGTLMAAAIVRLLGVTRPRANVVFWVLLALFASSLLNTGETYTPFRELAALLGMLLVHRALWSSRLWLPHVTAVCVAAWLFLLSPEMALAFMAAAAVYLVATLISRGEVQRAVRAALLLALLAAFFLLLRLASRAHEFDSARQFGAGGSDVPLLLNVTSAFVFGCLFVAAAFGAQQLRALRLRDPRIAAALIAFALLPGSLGRADPSHLVLYGTGAILVMLSFAAVRPERTWRRAVALTLLLAALPLLLSKLYVDRMAVYETALKHMYRDGVVPAGGPGRALDAAVLRRLGPGAEQKLRRRFERDPIDPHMAFPEASPELAAPWGYGVRGYADVLPPDVHLGYFDGFNDVMSPAQIQRKIAELATHPERDLLLPAEWTPANGCRESAHGGMLLLRDQYGYNYLWQQRHVPTVLDPVCAYIGAHYRLVDQPPTLQTTFYALWRRRP